MSLFSEIRTAILATIAWFVLTVILYPSLILLLSLVTPWTANGSLVDAQGQPTTNPNQAVGSLLIGQPFRDPAYFWSRPSTSAYSTADANNDPAGVLKTGTSGASNYAPSHPALLSRVQEEVVRLQGAGLTSIPADMVYTSGSSLDPHISPASAQDQKGRVATARQVPPEQLDPLIAQATDGRWLGLFGEPGVNVLKLNLLVNQQFPRS
ncbi:MAG: potassium-transporting ATPase subunit KdpC [Synechococcales cyanobacterium]